MFLLNFFQTFTKQPTCACFELSQKRCGLFFLQKKSLALRLLGGNDCIATLENDDARGACSIFHETFVCAVICVLTPNCLLLPFA